MTEQADPQATPTPPTPPTAQASSSRPAAGDATTRLSGRTVLIGFGLVLGVILLIAAIVAVVADAPEPPPDCPPGTECGGPPPAGDADASVVSIPSVAVPTSPAAVPPGTVGIRAGELWKSTDFGFEFEYSEFWDVDADDGRRVDLIFQGPADALLIVAAVPATDASAGVYADRWFSFVQSEAPDLRADTSEKNAILGPAIGYIDGIGRSYAGTWTSPQAATVPIGVSLVTASDGQTTVAVVLIVWNPDANIGSTWLQYGVRSTAELVLKTFRWGPSS